MRKMFPDYKFLLNLWKNHYFKFSMVKKEMVTTPYSFETRIHFCTDFILTIYRLSIDYLKIICRLSIGIFV